MRAELASLDDVRARRRYALGCVRAVLSDRTTLRTVALHVVALIFGAVALVFAISVNGVGVRIQTIGFVLALGVLAWSGRRSGPLGPKRRSAAGSAHPRRGLCGTGRVHPAGARVTRCRLITA